jgi:hypothetical protein
LRYLERQNRTDAELAFLHVDARHDAEVLATDYPLSREAAIVLFVCPRNGSFLTLLACTAI